jgi:hypothetical protein
VRLTSSSSGSTQLTATVTVQTSSTNWHVTTAAIDACTGTATPPSYGQVCTDGSIYAGISPDGNVEMFVTPCDAGMTGTQGNCTGTRQNIKWSSSSTQTTNVTSQATGKSNTATLHADDAISPYNADAPFSAADYCYNLNYLGHSDWYLPALGELNIMYQNQTAIGGFQTSTVYWSSSEDYGNSAWYEDFSSGAQNYNNKDTASVVRCARHN